MASEHERVAPTRQPFGAAPRAMGGRLLHFQTESAFNSSDGAVPPARLETLLRLRRFGDERVSRNGPEYFLDVLTNEKQLKTSNPKDGRQ